VGDGTPDEAAVRWREVVIMGGLTSRSGSLPWRLEPSLVWSSKISLPRVPTSSLNCSLSQHTLRTTGFTLPRIFMSITSFG
jgi:hypothetical protein